MCLRCFRWASFTLSGRNLPWRVGDAGVGRRWIEQSAVGLASSDGLGHGVVDFQNDALGVVLAVVLLVFALDDGERFHDVVCIVAGNAVEGKVISFLKAGSTRSDNLGCYGRLHAKRRNAT